MLPRVWRIGESIRPALHLRQPERGRSVRKKGNRWISCHPLQEGPEYGVHRMATAVAVRVVNERMVQAPECLADDIVQVRRPMHQTRVVHRVHILYHVQGVRLHADARCEHVLQRNLDRCRTVPAIVYYHVKGAVARADVEQEAGVGLRAKLNEDILRLSPRARAARVDVSADVVKVVPIELLPGAHRAARLDSHLKHLERLAWRRQMPIVEVRRLYIPMEYWRFVILTPDLA